jgi:adenine-specific DNA-methyltransferase
MQPMNLEAIRDEPWAEFLREVESARTRISAKLSPSKKAELGQFLTPSDVASFMAEMFSTAAGEIRILDPGAGIGSLTAALAAAIIRGPRPPKKVSTTLFEIDPTLIDSLVETMTGCAHCAAECGVGFEYRLIQDDFIESTASALSSPLNGPVPWDYDCCIMNPPYRKLRTDSTTRKVLSAAGIEANNFYSAFLALAARLLRDGGELVAITPRSFCNGPYFNAFRRDFLSRMQFRAIHVYESRSDAFHDDEVLQENIIFSAVKTRSEPERIVISTSLGPHDPNPRRRTVARESVIHRGDPELVVHIAPDATSEDATAVVRQLGSSLHALTLSVSTGRVVDFRAAEFLRATQGSDTVPLIYPFNLESGRVVWPKAHTKKPTAIVLTTATEDLLIPTDCYVVVKRFSAKEERRRLVAAVFDPTSVLAPVVGFENHLNYFHINGHGIPQPLARGLAAFLNSTLADTYFRSFNGHTQVNAQDLRRLPYPSEAQLVALAARVGDDVANQELVDGAILTTLAMQEPASIE